MNFPHKIVIIYHYILLYLSRRPTFACAQDKTRTRTRDFQTHCNIVPDYRTRSSGTRTVAEAESRVKGEEVAHNIVGCFEAIGKSEFIHILPIDTRHKLRSNVTPKITRRQLCRGATR